MILTLSSEHVRNAVFTDEAGQAIFVSDTPFRFGMPKTTISRHRTSPGRFEMNDHFEVVGQIDWHMFGSSIFRIGGRELESSVFLPRHGIFGRKRTFVGPDGRNYRWDMHSRVVVLSADDHSRTEIARFHRATLGIIGRRRKACLEIADQAEHILDLIILTFIYVEKVRMDKETRQRRAAASGGGP
ncbi:hypothetical protein HYDPIDRAFT_42854 [Hydnomerulius pinastri MD-312]|uniref:Unplaced genomic scaffold scaffold_31, whole genome shotgun sequence n=1 Tax=Hydnomerulius pinastri MD-312 TaxID=994086 RepID=A0A0C9WBB6_9AGAM|nr:hypothetical protein HYDPIDRAFT_42854 [Hydnomerulius pinastri MD-312]